MQAVAYSNSKGLTLKINTPLKLAWLCVLRSDSSYDQTCPKPRIIKRMCHKPESSSAAFAVMCLRV